nr:unnamed protein product [Haemonchus contortus]
MRWFAILFVLTLISARSAVAFPRYRRVYFDDIDMFMRRERSEEEAVRRANFPWFKVACFDSITELGRAA